MDETTFMELAHPAMSDESLLIVEIQVLEAWLLVSLIQLATRHPGIGSGLRANAESIARQFQQAIAERHPESNPALESGWNPENDR